MPPCNRCSRTPQVDIPSFLLGQGPYYGQAVWFALIHPERVQSAVERYSREIERVRGVLNKHLEGRDWLVGDKITVADLSWVMWENVVELLIGREMIKFDTSKFPNYDRWWKSLKERKSVEKATRMRAEGLEKHALVDRLEKERLEKAGQMDKS